MSGQEKNNREAALSLYLAQDGNITPTEIARQLGEKPATVRSWKKRDDWEGALQNQRCNADEKRCNADKPKKKRGAQPGNKNGLNNQGGAPLNNQNARGKGENKRGNRNAVKTGEFMSFSRDLMDEEELQFFDGMSTCPHDHATEELRILSMRERWMLQELKRLKAGLTHKERRTLQELIERKEKMPYIDKNSGKRVMLNVTHKDMVTTEIREVEKSKLDQVVQMSDALTRVQDKKLKLVKMMMDKEKEEQQLAIARERLELERYKIMGDAEDSNDDDEADDEW